MHFKFILSWHFFLCTGGFYMRQNVFFFFLHLFPDSLYFLTFPIFVTKLTELYVKKKKQWHQQSRQSNDNPVRIISFLCHQSQSALCKFAHAATEIKHYLFGQVWSFHYASWGTLSREPLGSILFFPLSLGFVVVYVVFVQLTEHFLNAHLQCHVQELYIPLNTEVQNAVDAFSQMCLDFWLKCHLQELIRDQSIRVSLLTH